MENLHITRRLAIRLPEDLTKLKEPELLQLEKKLREQVGSLFRDYDRAPVLNRTLMTIGLTEPSPFGKGDLTAGIEYFETCHAEFRRRGLNAPSDARLIRKLAVENQGRNLGDFLNAFAPLHNPRREGPKKPEPPKRPHGKL